MSARKFISLLFYLMAAYDGLLGAGFLVAPLRLIELGGEKPPYHPGYIQFPALLLVLFAIMFVQIALDPVQGRILIPYGILLKLSYSGVVFKYWLTTGVGAMWKPFAVIDAVTAVLFLWAYLVLKQDAGHRTQETG